MTLTDKVAIVTGAAQGIGARLAAGLAKAGAAVVVADVLDGSAVAGAIGERAITVRCDVTDPAAVQACIDAAGEAFGGVDILVNNAALFGTVQPLSLFDIAPADWDRMMAVNVKGVWLMAKAAAAAMRARGGGSMVNLATNRFWLGSPNLLHYDASKGAVIAMTRSMARELGDLGIRVNAVAPGLTMSENVLAKEGIADRAPLIAANRALKRNQLPEDLVGAVTFLASDAAAFMTGQTLVVDGGSAMH